MNCYIIPVGGTGARVMRSIIHLMATGAFVIKDTDYNIHFMCVDSDITNGDKILMEQTADEYIKIHDLGIVSKELVKPFTSEPSRVTWSPLDVSNKTLDEIEEYNTMCEIDKKLYEFLYTPVERGVEPYSYDKDGNPENLVLKGGFYSHTSIGSYYMTSGIASGTKYLGDWNAFFNSVRPDDKIIIICSMFGGTGASGVPTLARKIREMPTTSKCSIAGIFLEPYFKTNTADIINTKAFPLKSKIALEYYDNQGFDQEVFDKMYFLGEDSGRMMLVEHQIHNEKQRNKANAIELYAATAVVDFIRSDGSNEKKISWRGGKNTDSGFKLEPELLNMTAGGSTKVFDRLARFYTFSVMYTKFLFHCIMANDKRACRFLQYYNFYDSTGEVSQGVDTLYNYCMKFLEWMREIITDASPSGHYEAGWLSAVGAKSNPDIEWFAREQYELYNGKFIIGDTYLQKCKNLDKYTNANLPGFTGVVKTRDTISSEAIFTELCNNPVQRQYSRQPKSLQNFIIDVFKLSEKGTL